MAQVAQWMKEIISLHSIYKEPALKTLIVVWLLAIAFFLGAEAHEAYAWHQIEEQALAADLVEGAQE